MQGKIHTPASVRFARAATEQCLSNFLYKPFGVRMYHPVLPLYREQVACVDVSSLNKKGFRFKSSGSSSLVVANCIQAEKKESYSSNNNG